MKDGKVVKATAYASSGTSYSQFMVTQRGTSDVFDVLRITDGSTDNAPDGYTEPTTQQK